MYTIALWTILNQKGAKIIGNLISGSSSMRMIQFGKVKIGQKFSLKISILRESETEIVNEICTFFINCAFYNVVSTT